MADDSPALEENIHEALHSYIAALYAEEDSLLQELLRTAAQEGLPTIQVPATLGRFLSLLVRISGTKRILEIGTLSGYSAIWMARALPADGNLISLEVEAKHAELARRFIAKAGLAAKAEVRIGPALTSLETIAPEGPFDLVFIDANKDQYPEYLDWAIRLVRPGGLILADNALRSGGVLRDDGDAWVQATKIYNEKVAADPRLEAIILLTRDGTDGLSVARLRDTPVA